MKRSSIYQWRQKKLLMLRFVVERQRTSKLQQSAGVVFRKYRRSFHWEGLRRVYIRLQVSHKVYISGELTRYGSPGSCSLRWMTCFNYCTRQQFSDSWCKLGEQLYKINHDGLTEPHFARVDGSYCTNNNDTSAVKQWTMNVKTTTNNNERIYTLAIEVTSPSSAIWGSSWQL